MPCRRPPVRAAFLAFAAWCAAAALAHAQDVAPAPPSPAPALGIVSEIDGGILAHDVGIWSPDHLEHGVTFNGNVVFTPEYDALGGRIRPELGASGTTAGGTSYAYADLTYEILGPHSTFFRIGLGGAVHDGDLNPTSPDHKALGSRVLFHIPLTAGIDLDPHYRVSIYFEHVSNAYLTSPNEGLDNLGLRVGYRF